MRLALYKFVRGLPAHRAVPGFVSGLYSAVIIEQGACLVNERQGIGVEGRGNDSPQPRRQRRKMGTCCTAAEAATSPFSDGADPGRVLSILTFDFTILHFDFFLMARGLERLEGTDESLVLLLSARIRAKTSFAP
jgi:hypothetical protein